MEAMESMCGDNRFEIIKKAKEALLQETNIERSDDEMKVLFRGTKRLKRILDLKLKIY